MISVRIDPRGLARAMEDFNERQLPFATALALTRTAVAYNEHARAQLGQKFTIRSGWVGKGFRTRKATKRDLVAKAFHLDKFMALQEEGGDKTPLNRRTVAVPVGARPTPATTTPRSKWPGALHRRFVIDLKGGDALLMQRNRRRGRRRARKRDAAGRFIVAPSRRRRAFGPLQFRLQGQRTEGARVMYYLADRVRVPARWGYRADARAFVTGHFGGIFARAWAEANRPTVEARGVWARDR